MKEKQLRADKIGQDDFDRIEIIMESIEKIKKFIQMIYVLQKLKKYKDVVKKDRADISLSNGGEERNYIMQVEKLLNFLKFEKGNMVRIFRGDSIVLKIMNKQRDGRKGIGRLLLLIFMILKLTINYKS